MVTCALGRARVTREQPDVEVRLDADDTDDTGDGVDGVFDLRRLLHRGDVAVEQRRVDLDHHMDAREVEASFEGSDRGADPIGEHVVGDIGVGLPPAQAVADAAPLPEPVARDTGKAVTTTGEGLARPGPTGEHRARCERGRDESRVRCSARSGVRRTAS